MPRSTVGKFSLHIPSEEGPRQRVFAGDASQFGPSFRTFLGIRSRNKIRISVRNYLATLEEVMSSAELRELWGMGRLVVVSHDVYHLAARLI